MRAVGRQPPVPPRHAADADIELLLAFSHQAATLDAASANRFRYASVEARHMLLADIALSVVAPFILSSFHRHVIVCATNYHTFTAFLPVSDTPYHIHYM